MVTTRETPSPPARIDPTPASPSTSPLWRVAGAVFAVLFIAGMLMVGGTPGYDAADTEWTEWYADGGNRTVQVVGAVLLIVSALAFGWFAVELVARLRHRLHGNVTGDAAAIGFAWVFVAGLSIGAVTTALVSFAIDLGDVSPPSAELMQYVEQLGYGITALVAGLAAAACLASLSAIGMRAASFPRWLALTGFLAAMLLLFSVTFLPFLVLPLWVLAVAITGSPKPSAE